MSTWRLLDDGITDAYHHFAVEETLARLVDEGHSPPTLRLRQVRRAVSVGVVQDPYAEVDVEFCRAHEVSIVRRMNGGGTVYHDVGSFCYSAFFPRVYFPASDAELFGLFARPVLRTCADYGLAATMGGRNDGLVDGRKIYGSAQMAWYDTFVQSGTFLVAIDFDMMAQTLKPSALKFADKSARTIYDRVTSLSRELGYTVPVTEVESRFVANFAAEFGIMLEPGDLTLGEHDLAAELLQVKYGTDGWNLGKRQTFSVSQAAKTPLGIVTLALDMDGDTICAARLGGDLLLTDGGAALAALGAALSNTSLTAAPDLVARTSVPEEIRMALVRLLRESAAAMCENERGEAGQ